jgi:AcrR family transcriptional regulator
MAEPQHEPLRADAQQNRERILSAARDALAASGEASLNSIAKRAGVGPGTLYRHFPSREALILAVYRYDLQQLADAAPDLLSDHPPIEALRLWSGRLAHYGLIKHALAGALHAASSDGLTGETCDPVVGAIRLLLTACEQDGSIGPGHDPDDVLLLLAFLWRVDPGPDASARTARLLDIVISGLRAGAPAPERPARGYRRARRPPRTQRTSRLSLLSILRTRPPAHQAETAAPPGPRA